MKRIIVEVMNSSEGLKRMKHVMRRLDAGKEVQPTIGVPSLGELTALLSPKRLELLHYVAEHPQPSVTSLAKALRRDYKNVHTDVAELEGRYLLARDERGWITAPYDEIVIKAPLRKAA